MTRPITTMLLILAASWLSAATNQAQESPRRDRGPHHGPPEFFTPEQRERMYQHAAERHLERFTEYYELTDEQRELVRARLEQLKAKQYEYIESMLDEFKSLRLEMIELYHKRRAGEEIAAQRMDELRDRMRTIWQGSPLMNPERAAQSIEELLPAEQVETGRKRREQRRADMEARRRNWQEQREEFRQSGREGNGEMGRVGFGRTDPWDSYVESFIRRYQLDASQQATAQSILRTLKQQRDARREARQEDFDALRDIADRDERSKRYRELNEPLERLFDELEERLMKLPTSSQLVAAAESGPTSRPAWASSRPARATSRPAGDEGRPRRSYRFRGRR